MKILDLFCGAGGAGMGYHRAGSDVTGVDLFPQPNYPLQPEPNPAAARTVRNPRRLLPPPLSRRGPMRTLQDSTHRGPASQAEAAYRGAEGKSSRALTPPLCRGEGTDRQPLPRVPDDPDQTERS